MKIFVFCHWIGFLFSISLFVVMGYWHTELNALLIYLHESASNTGTYFGWLASLLFTSTLPAFAGWLMGRIANSRQKFLPFK